jgi:hypothetical protein
MTTIDNNANYVFIEMIRQPLVTTRFHVQVFMAPLPRVTYRAVK